jgi:DNA-binding CsgD family transcriptional regulator
MTLDDFAEAAQAARGLDELTEVARDTLEATGFIAFMFSGGREGRASAFMGVCDRPYLKRYRDRRLDVIDPVARQVRGSWLPVAWNCEDYIDSGQKSLAELFEGSAMVGYARGISAPVYGPFGQKRVLAAIFGGGRNELDRSRHRLGHELMVLGAHLACACDRLEPARADPLKLTARQRECLSWSARGKTAWEVSRIIGVTERTVNFHIQAAMSTLGASSKHHAWLRATQLGIIEA